MIGSDGPVLVMSRRGLSALRAGQRRAIEAHVQVLAVDIPTIELAGVSARWMLAGIHLQPNRSPPATSASS